MTGRYWSLASTIVLIILAGLCVIGFALRLIKVQRLRGRTVNPVIIAAFEKAFLEI